MGAALALGIGYAVWPSEERRILGLLEDLCEKLNRARDAASIAPLNEAVVRAAAPNFTLRVSELADESRGLAESLAWAGDLAPLPPRSFSLVDPRARIEGSLARVRCDLLISERGSSEQHRDLRPMAVDLRRVNGHWLIESITIDPIAPDRPEPRP